MKQVLYIFAKDSRHFWPEIGVSLAMMAAFTWLCPKQWLQNQLGAAAGFDVLSAFTAFGSFIAFWVTVSWWILISRVIHDESLVGDRQFWLTRPIEWKKLLAAKSLFLLVYLYVPLVTVKLVLLALAGFHPLSYLPGLLFNLVLMTAFLVMPLLALATVTSNFPRITLTVVGIILCFVAILVFAAVTGASVSIGFGEHVVIVLMLCVCGAAITLQYAARRVWLSRLLLIGFPITIAVLAFVLPSHAIVEREYPPLTANQTMPIQLTSLKDSAHPVTVSVFPKQKQVTVNIPLAVSGVADGYMLMPNGVKVSIDAPNGAHWNLPWQATSFDHYLPGPQNSSVNLILKKSLFDTIPDMPLTLHLTFALAELRAGRERHFLMSVGDLFVPHFGICAPTKDWEGSQQVTGLFCRAPLRDPRLTYVEVHWSDDPCSATTASTVNTVSGAAWAGNLDDDPADFGISPVSASGLNLSNSMRDTGEKLNPQKPRYLCPGSPVTFTQYDPVKQIQVGLTIQDFHFPR